MKACASAIRTFVREIDARTVVMLLCGIVFFFGVLPQRTAAQYTDRQAIDDLGGPEAFAARRTALAKELKTGYAILFARNEIPEATHYREDTTFIISPACRIPAR